MHCSRILDVQVNEMFGPEELFRMNEGTKMRKSLPDEAALKNIMENVELLNEEFEDRVNVASFNRDVEKNGGDSNRTEREVLAVFGDCMNFEEIEFE